MFYPTFSADFEYLKFFIPKLTDDYYYLGYLKKYFCREIYIKIEQKMLLCTSKKGAISKIYRHQSIIIKGIFYAISEKL
jgi:hypothetical protein